MGQQWTVGDITISRLDSSNFVLPSERPMPAWAVPAFTPSVDETPLAFSALVIEARGTRIVVDPWIVDDAPRTAPNADALLGERLAQLAALGIEPDAVEIVVNTHIDGFGWNTRPTADGWRPTFPNARYLFPADELAAVDRGMEINGSEHIGPLYDAGVVERIDPPYDVVPGVSLVNAPGHNPGHVAVRVDDGGDMAIYPGHLILSLSQVDDPGYSELDSDAATATATRQAFLGELADRGGVLLTTLIGGPGGGVVEAHGDGFALVAG